LLQQAPQRALGLALGELPEIGVVLNISWTGSFLLIFSADVSSTDVIAEGKKYEMGNRTKGERGTK
jgi:hypothetical protein